MQVSPAQVTNSSARYDQPDITYDQPVDTTSWDIHVIYHNPIEVLLGDLGEVYKYIKQTLVTDFFLVQSQSHYVF